MKIATAQIKFKAGDISANVSRHSELIELAASQNANLIYFPELSITGYEPTLAKSLAMEVSSTIFDVFQSLSDRHNLIIGVGAPLSYNSQVYIGMVWFQPYKPRSSYTKQLLDSDETPFFISGDSQLIIQTDHYQLAPAICYESLQSSHSDKAVELDVNVYLASVAMSSTSVEKAAEHYSKIAKKNNMFVVLSNNIGPCDDFIAAGKSAAWDSNGKLLAQLDSKTEGVLIVDIDRNNATIYK